MSRSVRAITLGCLATMSVLVAPIGTSAAGADPIGTCTTTSGAIVAVDFAHWGGPVVRGCGVNPPSGYALLHAAGFITAGDSHDGPGFICRIGNRAYEGGAQYPTAAQDACIRTPPVTAYWSYWHAAAGQRTWSYGQLGVTSELPTPGEVELWIFGGTDLGGATGSGVPTFSPDSLRAHNVSPTTDSSPRATVAPGPPTQGPPTPATTPATVNPSSGVGPPPPTARNPGTNGSSTAATAPSPSSVTRTAVAGPAPAPGSTTPLKLVDALPTAADHPSSGSVLPLLIGLSLVILLGGGAAGTTWRRRQRE
jgi:hypothetical protein